MGDEKWLKIPYFGKGKFESLERALTSGRYVDGLDKALFYFATDTKQWILVDVDKTMHIVTSSDGEDRGAVKRYDSLPSVASGDLSTIYLVRDEMFSFDGERYVAVDNKIGELPESSTTVVDYISESRDDAIASANQYTNEQMQLNIIKGGS